MAKYIQILLLIMSYWYQVGFWPKYLKKSTNSSYRNIRFLNYHPFIKFGNIFLIKIFTLNFMWIETAFLSFLLKKHKRKFSIVFMNSLTIPSGVVDPETLQFLVNSMPIVAGCVIVGVTTVCGISLFCNWYFSPVSISKNQSPMPVDLPLTPVNQPMIPVENNDPAAVAELTERVLKNSKKTIAYFDKIFKDEYAAQLKNHVEKMISIVDNQASALLNLLNRYLFEINHSFDIKLRVLNFLEKGHIVLYDHLSYFKELDKLQYINVDCPYGSKLKNAYDLFKKYADVLTIKLNEFSFDDVNIYGNLFLEHITFIDKHIHSLVHQIFLYESFMKYEFEKLTEECFTKILLDFESSINIALDTAISKNIDAEIFSKF